MPINVIERIDIESTQSAIADYMFDPNNDTEWISGIYEVKSISQIPITAGTKVHRVAHFLAKDIDYILEVVDIEDNHLLAMEAVKSPFPMKVKYVLKEKTGSDPLVTTTEIQVEGSTKGFFYFMDRLLKLMVSRSIKGDLRRLKSIMENDPDQEID